jgi:DNA-binding NtrC family response regulator
VNVERVLLVDDDATLRFALTRMLEQLGYEVEGAATVREAEGAVRGSRLDAAILDYQLPDGTALDILPSLQATAPRVPTVILTGYASIELAVRTLQEGADHFLTKPIELPALAAVVARLVELGRSERHQLAKQAVQPSGGADPFLGRDPKMRELAEEARRVAAAGTTVLIQGETGVGKGLLASWIHDQSPRRQEPFVDLNCAVLSRELLESELFGHRKGAFTGALEDKVGLLEVAHHGTVFLDEIGDLDVEVQPKLLKAVEDKRFRRVGDVTDRPVDVRLVAATHQDLNEAVAEGRFRRDLYYRISTVPLRVPPLRERREDIPLLAEHLLNGLAAELGRLSVRLSQEALDVLCSYSWPGNVRELKNVLERAVLLSRDDMLTPGDLRFESAGPGTNETDGPRGLSLEAVERHHIEMVLRLTGGNVAEAARRLEVPRSSLYERIRRHGIEVSEIRT